MKRIAAKYRQNWAHACGLSLCLVAALVTQRLALSQEGSCDWSSARELHPGIRYVRVATNQPRKMVVHGARIDTQTPGLRLYTTPRRPEWVEGKTETDRRTTRDFLRDARAKSLPMVFAVNADAFSPWPAPYNQSTPTDLLGLAVSERVVVSRGSGTPSLIKQRAGGLRIEATGRDFDAKDVEWAVSGFALCLDRGQPLAGGDDLHPRTGLGLSEDGRWVVVAAIDGRQPSSVGATTQELGQWLRHFGASRGINMDGGGSTTFAWWNPAAKESDKCQLLNQPVGSGSRLDLLPLGSFQPTERANGNNLGVVIDAAGVSESIAK